MGGRGLLSKKNHDKPQATAIIPPETILLHYKARKMQECLESGLERGLGFDIREGDIILGNFEELDMHPGTDKRIEASINRVSCRLATTM